ncbi:hypothetical protein SS50377_27639 [Spironucleus salmonicida]|uniref:Uncharacterized protein n=1 Tax=Spironucleus salmonicida TaxID=348837 RepID=V6LQQ7_9EUKA|nr:hypothetical protein SS50377_27639 [Spironucleus salmonicida]|eukprot:EST46583.1 Hypothetical protein SS50377_13387 [Spironucleus salmonicida]
MEFKPPNIPKQKGKSFIQQFPLLELTTPISNSSTYFVPSILDNLSSPSSSRNIVQPDELPQQLIQSQLYADISDSISDESFQELGNQHQLVLRITASNAQANELLYNVSQLKRYLSTLNDNIKILSKNQRKLFKTVCQ